MTYEEAMIHFKEQLEIFNGEHHEAMKVAIEALEKQIPKKPKYIKVPNTSFTKSCSRYVCPTCGNSLFSGCGCDNNDCGQRIDWSE